MRLLKINIGVKVAVVHHQQTASLRCSTDHLSVPRLDSSAAAKDFYIHLHLLGSSFCEQPLN